MTVEQVESWFTMLGDYVVSGYMFDKRYWRVTPDREVWGKNKPNQLKKGQTWLTDKTCNHCGAEVGI